MRRPVTIGLLGGLTLAAFGGIFYAGRLTAPKPSPQKQASSQHTPPAGQVTLSTQAQKDIGLQSVVAVTRRIDPRLAATGIVAADHARSVQLRALGRGRVLSVGAQAGDAVHRGQVLLTYDDLTLAGLRMQLAGARAALAQASAAAQSAEDAYSRGRALAGQTVSTAEVERRRAAAAAARAQVATQQAAIADLQQQIDQFGAATGNHGTAIAAPFDGFVLTSAAASGDMLQAGQIVMEVADLSTVWVMVQVYQNDLQKVRQGGAATISITGLPGQEFEGTVANVGHALDPRTGAVQVRCDVANPNQVLRLGMFANAELPTIEGRDALVVPAAAVQSISDKPVVFVRQSADTFMRRAVELGVQTSQFDEIRQGIRPGDAVVTSGSFQLKSQALQDELGAGS